MTQRKQEWSSSLVKVRRDLITKGPSPLARRALDDLARLRAQPPSGPERTPFHVLYADGGEEIGNIFHKIVMRALGEIRHIVPVWVSHEQEIRLLSAQRQFDFMFLILNNIIVPEPREDDERIKRVLALIAWLRGRGSATLIIALSGWSRFTMKEVLHAGADRFFPLPFPVVEVVDLLRKRFGEPAGP